MKIRVGDRSGLFWHIESISIHDSLIRINVSENIADLGVYSNKFGPVSVAALADAGKADWGAAV